LTNRGLQHSFCSEYAEAESKELEAVRLASEARDGLHLALSLFFLGITQANRGRLSEALATLHRGWDAAQRNNNRMLLARMPNALGWVYRELNDLPRAVEFNRRSVEFARQSKTAEAEANALINLVYAYIDANEMEQAGVALRESAPPFDDDPWHRWRFFDIRHEAATAEWHLARRSLDEAYEHASRLRANATRYRARKYLVEAQRLLGQTLLASGDCDRAVAECRAGIEALHGEPIPLVAWRMWACLAESLAAVGDQQRAQEAMAESAAILRTVAGSLTDSGARAAFLNAPAVRAVVGSARV
jgi:tetratricopeptide (TPR) repeat protein